MKRSFSTILAVSLVGGLFLPMPAVATESLTRKFSNCSELNRTYPGGVAKSSTVKNKGGLTKVKPTVNAKVYAENSGKDRDKDGIACER